jgi:restriction system protein
VIPDKQGMTQPTLRLLADGKIWPFRPLRDELQGRLDLTEADLARRTGDDRRTAYSYALSEALQYMIDEGLVLNPTRAHYCISNAGKAYLQTRTAL